MQPQAHGWVQLDFKTASSPRLENYTSDATSLPDDYSAKNCAAVLVAAWAAAERSISNSLNFRATSQQQVKHSIGGKLIGTIMYYIVQLVYDTCIKTVEAQHVHELTTLSSTDPLPSNYPSFIASNYHQHLASTTYERSCIDADQPYISSTSFSSTSAYLY